jgi:hypothetical protein
MALKNAFRAALFVDGKELPGGFEWDGFTGGKWTQKETKYTPYDGVQRTYVSQKEVENITLEADYQEAVHGAILATLNGEAGDIRGKVARVVVKDRDINGNFQQNRPPYNGTILEVMGPDGDSNDASSVSKISIVISTGVLAA